MQPTISIPKHWDYPKAITNSQFASRNYLTANCELRIANCFGWRYVLMPNKNSEELFHFQESQIQPLSPQELFSQIRAEIDFYQEQIAIRQQQLLAITGDSTNG